MKTRVRTPWLAVAAAALAWSGVCVATAAEAKKVEKPAAPPATAKTQPGVKPTVAGVAYGTSPKQVLDFYKAESPTPTPLVFFIHGGGWRAATDKARCRGCGRISSRRGSRSCPSSIASSTEARPPA